jgi:hypothetical protein
MSSKPIPPTSPDPGKPWLAQLAKARSEEELLKACRRYLASLRSSGLEKLPLACRPIPLEDAADLSAYALQLVRYHCDVDDPSPLVQRMAAFFARANMRLAQILREMNDAAAADGILARLGRPRRNDPSTDSTPSSGDPSPGASPDGE